MHFSGMWGCSVLWDEASLLMCGSPGLHITTFSRFIFKICPVSHFLSWTSQCQLRHITDTHTKKTPQHHKESKSLSFEKYWQQKYSKVHREQEWFLRNFWTRWMGKDTYQTLMTRVWLLQPSWCWKARIDSCKLPSDLHTHICSEGMHRHAEAN